MQTQQNPVVKWAENAQTRQSEWQISQFHARTAKILAAVA
jgi:hypothetical protein